MLTFKSNKYKKEDLVAFAVALEYQNERFIKCPDKQKNNCFYYISSDVSESTNIGEVFHAKWGQIDSDKFKRYINDSYFTMSQMVDVANEIMCRR